METTPPTRRWYQFQAAGRDTKTTAYGLFALAIFCLLIAWRAEMPYRIVLYAVAAFNVLLASLAMRSTRRRK